MDRREAACCYCRKMIQILDYSPPDSCAHCGRAVEWDWYEDHDHGPHYFSLKTPPTDVERPTAESFMYDRFTDRARKVMELANQEAIHSNHEYVGTEHILLGLIKEGSGVARNVLKNLDIDLNKARAEVEKLVYPGLDMVQMGKLPLTPRSKKAIEYAIEEARDLGHNYIGTEHQLLGLLREEEGIAAQVLMNCGVKLQEVRQEILDLLGHPKGDETEIGRARCEDMMARIKEIINSEPNAVVACGKIRRVFP